MTSSSSPPTSSTSIALFIIEDSPRPQKRRGLQGPFKGTNQFNLICFYANEVFKEAKVEAKVLSMLTLLTISPSPATKQLISDT